MNADREIELLEQQLEDARMNGDYEEERLIAREIQEISHEERDRERWQEEGRDRGWR
jgi:hypothetical protein